LPFRIPTGLRCSEFHWGVNLFAAVAISAQAPYVQDGCGLRIWSSSAGTSDKVMFSKKTLPPCCFQAPVGSFCWPIDMKPLGVPLPGHFRGGDRSGGFHLLGVPLPGHFRGGDRSGGFHLLGVPLPGHIRGGDRSGSFHLLGVPLPGQASAYSVSRQRCKVVFEASGTKEHLAATLSRGLETTFTTTLGVHSFDSSANLLLAFFGAS